MIAKCLKPLGASGDTITVSKITMPAKKS